MKKRLISLILAGILIIAMLSGIATHTFASEVGTQATTSTMVSENLRLAEVKMYENGILAQEVFLEYNDQQLLKSVYERWLDEDGQISDETTYRYFYDSQENLIRREKDCSSLDYTFVDEYIYNQHGQLESSTTGDSGGWSRNTYEYDSNGLLIRTTEEIQIYTLVTDYTYNSEGILTEAELTYDEYGEISVHKRTYEYDSEERLCRIVTVGPNSTETETYEYDDQGRKMQIVREYAWGTTCSTYDYDYMPFVVYEYNSSDVYDVYLQLDSWSLYLGDAELHANEKGYLATAEVSNWNRIYEFYYDGAASADDGDNSSSAGFENQSPEYSVTEIEEMVADYYNCHYQDEAYPGTYVVFHSETTVSGNTCNTVVRFQSSSSSPTTAANVLVAFVSVDMRTGVMTIETMDGDVEVQLFGSIGETQPVEIPEPVPTMASFNEFFVANYYDSLNRMYQYESAAQGIVENSSAFQINWNSCLAALSNKEFLDVLELENHPEYYYQTVLLELIMQTKLNDNYLSALSQQISAISVDALSLYVSYDANFDDYEDVLKQKLNTAMTDFSVDSVQYKRLKDYYGQYCKQLDSFETVRSVYDLVVKADGSVEDFFNALSNYSSVYEASEEIIAGLKYLQKNLEMSTNKEDQYILMAVNNVLASLDRTVEKQLLINCMGTAKDLLWDIFWAAIQDAFPQMKALGIASFTVDTGLTLSNVFFPITISSDSYCKIYADYAIEVVLRQALHEAYNSCAANPTTEMATITVGLYDLLGYTYAHEIEVASVLSEQLHRDGLLNGLKNLFSAKNMDMYEYEQACINAYEAYLNDILSIMVEAQNAYGLLTDDLHPIITVYFVNGKVAAVDETTISTGDVYHVSYGEFPLPDFVDFRIEIEGYYLDQQFHNLYEEGPVNKPLSLYCNLLLTKVSDGTPVLLDHSTGISISTEESMAKYTLCTSAVTSGNAYSTVEEYFSESVFELYDISMSENGEQIQPSSEVIVEIPINPDYSNRDAKVYHVGENGEFEDMNAVCSGDVLHFTTNHFSYFVVVYESPARTWLIPIIIVAVLGCAGAPLIVALKIRKKKQKTKVLVGAIAGVAVILVVVILTLMKDTHEHTWTDTTCTDPRTCEECGETEGETLGHQWLDATCAAARTCARCGKTEGSALAHTWQEATCETPRTCSVCRKTEGVELGHRWIDATYETPKTCSVCGRVEGDVLVRLWKYINELSYIDSYGKVWLLSTERIGNTVDSVITDEKAYTEYSAPAYVTGAVFDYLGNAYTYGLCVDGLDYSEYSITYYLGGQYTTFSGYVSMTPDVCTDPAATEGKCFEVYGDGVLLGRSPTMTNSLQAQFFSIDVTGVDVLTIQYPKTTGPSRMAMIYDGKVS